ESFSYEHSLTKVGKGRDVGLGQIAAFVAKISMGNGMQSRSREVSVPARRPPFAALRLAW
ncbi:unnamed protein product, partial [Sphacelaria rigidula]